jgi:hypothetical protein
MKNSLSPSIYLSRGGKRVSKKNIYKIFENKSTFGGESSVNKNNPNTSDNPNTPDNMNTPNSSGDFPVAEVPNPTEPKKDERKGFFETISDSFKQEFGLDKPAAPASASEVEATAQDVPEVRAMTEQDQKFLDGVDAVIDRFSQKMSNNGTEPPNLIENLRNEIKQIKEENEALRSKTESLEQQLKKAQDRLSDTEMSNVSSAGLGAESDMNSPEPMGPEPTGPEPTGPEPMGSEPMGSEPMGPEPMGPEPMGPEPMGPETSVVTPEPSEFVQEPTPVNAPSEPLQQMPPAQQAIPQQPRVGGKSNRKRNKSRKTKKSKRTQ